MSWGPQRRLWQPSPPEAGTRTPHPSQWLHLHEPSLILPGYVNVCKPASRRAKIAGRISMPHRNIVLCKWLLGLPSGRKEASSHLPGAGFLTRLDPGQPGQRGGETTGMGTDRVGGPQAADALASFYLRPLSPSSLSGLTGPPLGVRPPSPPSGCFLVLASLRPDTVLPPLESCMVYPGHRLCSSRRPSLSLLFSPLLPLRP